MNIFKIFFFALLSATASIHSYDFIQEAILDSDYAKVSHYYNAQETSENVQHAYWALADDTAKMRSTNFAFDWCKMFASRKLLTSAFSSILFYNLTVKLIEQWKLKKIDSETYKKLNDNFPVEIAIIAAAACMYVSEFFLVQAITDGHSHYLQLQERIKDAERIKFLIMSN